MKTRIKRFIKNKPKLRKRIYQKTYCGKYDHPCFLCEDGICENVRRCGDCGFSQLLSNCKDKKILQDFNKKFPAQNKNKHIYCNISNGGDFEYTTQLCCWYHHKSIEMCWRV